ncbi:MAG TPA: alkaline phosphatase family protein [Bryobacteraceae bacterium]|jgi:phospholipase C|nr:alkaline phosphatase family protein [Bryobacteraceae bacterium]
MPTHIQHIFVLMMENRSFDHLLGFSGITGVDAVTGNPTSVNGLTGREGNAVGDRNYPVTRPVRTAMAFDPGHEFENVLEQLAGPGTQPPLPAGGSYPPIHLTGFAASFAGTTGVEDPGEVMKCFDPAEIPVLVSLAKEFAVCDSWFSSMPGPTWPNRFFVAAGTSGGLDHSPTNKEIGEWEVLKGFTIQNGTIFDSTNLKSRIYCGGILCIAQTLKNIDFRDVHPYAMFASDIHSPSEPYAPQFTFIEPDYGNFLGAYTGGTSQHPLDSITGGERLIKEVYETIRNSPLWENSVLIVTWDEHGGFYDHVVPPAAPPPGDAVMTQGANQFGFDFGTYGVRVPAVVISPFVEKNIVDHRLYDHTSILATTRECFGGVPFTARDAAARSVMSLLSRTEPRMESKDAPKTLPDPVAQPPAPNLSVPDPGGPVHGANLPGFLGAALRSHLVLAADHECDAIYEFVSGLKTRAEAVGYIQEIEQKIAAHRGSEAQVRAAAANTSH